MIWPSYAAAFAVLKMPNSKPHVDVLWLGNLAIAGMRRLVGYGCNCDAEVQTWQEMVQTYRDPEYDVVELRQLRDSETTRTTAARSSGVLVHADPRLASEVLASSPTMRKPGRAERANLRVTTMTPSLC